MSAALKATGALLVVGVLVLRARRRRSVTTHVVGQPHVPAPFRGLPVTPLRPVGTVRHHGFGVTEQTVEEVADAIAESVRISLDRWRTEGVR